MATMGLRINAPSSVVKTSMADDFIKALFGDADTEIKLAKLRSDMATDEFQRRQYQAAIDHYKAQTGAIENEQNAYKAAVPGGVEEIGAAQKGFRGEPAPVEPFSLPETTSEFPLRRSTAMPAPVDLGATGGGGGGEPAPLPDVAPIDFPAGPAPTATGDFTLAPGPTDDSAYVVDGTGRRSKLLSRKEAEAQVYASQFKADPAGQVSKYAGIAGILSDQTLTETQKRAALLEGKVPSRESIVGTKEAIEKEVEVAKQTAKFDPAKSTVEYNGIHFYITPNPDPTKPPILTPIPNQGTITETNDNVRQKAIVDDKGNITSYENIPGAATDPKRGVIEKDGLQYQLGYDDAGQKIMTLLPGQEEKLYASGTIEGDALNFIDKVNQKRDHNEIVDSDTERKYAAAYDQVYGDKISKTLLPNGRYDVTTIKRPPPARYRRPDQLGIAGPLPAAPAPVATEPAPVATETQPAEVQPQSSAALDAVAPETAVQEPSVTANPAATPEPVQPMVSPLKFTIMPDGTKNYSGWGDTTAPETRVVPLEGGGTFTSTVTGDVKNPTVPKWAADLSNHVIQAIPAMKYLNDVGTRGPGVAERILMRLGENGSLTEDFIRTSLQGEEEQGFARAIMIFANSQLRPDTGAAINSREFRDYTTIFAPAPGSSATETIRARNARNQALLARRISLTGNEMPQTLEKIDRMFHQYEIDLEEGTPGYTPQGQAPAAPTKGDWREVAPGEFELIK